MAKNYKKKVETNYPDFVSEVVGLSIENLESRILMYTKERERFLDQKEKDEELQKVSELKKELEAPYRENATAIGLKVKYLLGLLEEKGGEV
jgi:hypothetical protein